MGYNSNTACCLQEVERKSSCVKQDAFSYNKHFTGHFHRKR